MGNYLFLLLILACPLMMIWMMRGMRGGQGGDAGRQAQRPPAGHGRSDSNAALDELRRRRVQLDREIEEREADEETPTPIGGGWR